MGDVINPFSVRTPEDIPAEQAQNLFVNVFSDFPKILGSGHVFLNGPRGSGKSMIFRYLQPDCQMLDKAVSSPDKLDFIGVHVPLKNCDLKLTELRRLEGQHANVVLNEHFMTLYVAGKVFQTMSRLTKGMQDAHVIVEAGKFFDDTFVPLLRQCGHMEVVSRVDAPQCVSDWFLHLERFADQLFSRVIAYLRRLAFRQEIVPFDGPLCGYLDFLYPLLRTLNQLSFMPGDDKPVYLLIDDADNLNVVQTRILNSWVSSRTSRNVSLKISTQMRYKTRLTVTGETIDTPHDYSEINISTIYTSQKKKYRDRITEIVNKRLAFAGIANVSCEGFFPKDADQEQAIAEIAKRFREDWAANGRGYRPDDDAIRYARPDYMKSLAGTSKQSHTYRYAGFEQLVHISSGIIRFFLEAAAQMYSEVQSQADGHSNTQIPASIQDAVVRKQAEDFLFADLGKMQCDAARDSSQDALLEKLGRLVRALGGLFRLILLSERSERRVFSIALSDDPSPELRQVFELGMQYGYFQESTIGNKDGTGRTRLYILSRRLAPLFNLDPTSFAGYLFIKCDSLERALHDPDAFVRSMEKRITGTSGEPLEERQLQLFE